MALTRAIAIRPWTAAREGRRRWIPALPTLWPGMLSPLAPARPAPFPFGAPRVTHYYLARNAVWHGARLLGLEGKEVLVPAYHHGVEVGALADAGAIPVFVRVDARMRLDLEDVERRIGPRTRAIYVIHYAGFAQAMDEVNALARRHGLLVVEDCALSLLAAEGTRPLGSTGHAGVFCFYKTLPVPNGGALVVNDPAVLGEVPRPDPAPLASTLSHATGSLLANAALRFGGAGEALRAGVRKGYALVRGASGLQPVSTGTMTFDPATKDLGMSGLSEVIARRCDADAIVAARRRNYFLLLGRLRDRVPPVFAEVPPGASPLFYPLVCEDKAAVQARLAANGVETVDFWREGHPRCPPGAFPEVDALRRRVLELPVHQDLAPDDMARVARAAREALG
ncbi:MAG TPA: DegT/DnrJ/EryC1/StrS family aminotransferase [Anaeromyxobacter sp.]|nr:DegT/DnrJ/EryC1/StrS family aminotransferase [Anaeromyxobacter sp.]